MKRQSTNQLSGRRLILPVLTVLALSFLAIPDSAEARVRVKIKTPIISAVFHSGAHGSGINVMVPDRHRHVVITKSDRRIAGKLAKRIDYTKRELLQLRRMGYSWNQIGRLLHLPRNLMRSVLHTRWIKCGNDGHLNRDYYENRYDRYDRYERDDRRHDDKNRVIYKKRVIR